MSQNPEVILARNAELAITEAHLTYVNRKNCAIAICSAAQGSRLGGGAAAPTAPLWLRHCEYGRYQSFLDTMTTNAFFHGTFSRTQYHGSFGFFLSEINS